MQLLRNFIKKNENSVRMSSMCGDGSQKFYSAYKFVTFFPPRSLFHSIHRLDDTKQLVR